MAPGQSITPEATFLVWEAVKRHTASSEHPERLRFFASWIAREIHLDIQQVRQVLMSLTSPETNEHPWLAAYVQLRCPTDDRILAMVPFGTEFSPLADCPEDGEVEIDPQHIDVVFQPTDALIAEASVKKKVPQLPAKRLRKGKWLRRTA